MGSVAMRTQVVTWDRSANRPDCERARKAVPKAIDEDIMLDVALECVIFWLMFGSGLYICESLFGCVSGGDDLVRCWDKTNVDLCAYICLLAAEMTHM